MGDSLTVKPIHDGNKSYRHLYIHQQKTFWLCKSVCLEQELRKGWKCFGGSPAAQSICLTFILIFILHSCINCLFLHNSIQQKIKVYAGSKAKLILLFQLFQPHKRINYFRTINFYVRLDFESGTALEKCLYNCYILCLFNGTVMYHLAKSWQFLLIYRYHSFQQYLLI